MSKLDMALLEENIEKAALYDFENGKVFGSAYCVIRGSEVVYKKCFGSVSADTDEPVTENTVFRMASMTKAAQGRLLSRNVLMLFTSADKVGIDFIAPA